jgi:hypothetical protein
VREALGLPTNVLKLETPHYVVVEGDNVRLRSSPSYEHSTILRHLQQSVVLEHHDMNGDWVMVSVVLSDLRLGKLDVGCTEGISLPSLGGSRSHSVKVGFELSPTRLNIGISGMISALDHVWAQ